MKCAVIGLGYIGLPTATILANAGHNVIGIDIKKEIINSLIKKKIHINEPGLSDLLIQKIDEKKISFSNDIESAEVFIITVPTPFIEDKNCDIPTPDLSYVISAANSIAKKVKKGDLIILESTSPVGTTEIISKIIFDKSGLASKDIHIAYCPERVIPGNILKELVENSRVIGGLTIEASQKAKLFYSTFCKGNLDITNTKVAELVKLSENTFRDINIAFSNELSIICDKLKISTLEVIKYSNKHPRVNILNPGCGVGGHCIAVDPWFIASKFPDNSDLIKTARKVNLEKTEWVINKIKNKANELLLKHEKKLKIGIMGLSFKPDVDDLRESPAYYIAKNLKKLNFQIYACEPNINECLDIEIFNLEHVIKKSDLLIFLVSHKEFLNLNIDKPILDFCGIF